MRVSAHGFNRSQFDQVPQSLEEELQSDLANAFRNVISWEEAFGYCEDDISKWCRMGARLRLYNHLAELNRDRFRQWNETARGFADPLERFVAKALSVAGIPETVHEGLKPGPKAKSAQSILPLSA